MKKVIVISLCMSVYALQSAQQPKLTRFQQFKSGVKRGLVTDQKLLNQLKADNTEQIENIHEIKSLKEYKEKHIAKKYTDRNNNNNENYKKYINSQFKKYLKDTRQEIAMGKNGQPGATWKELIKDSVIEAPKAIGRGVKNIPGKIKSFSKRIRKKQVTEDAVAIEDNQDQEKGGEGVAMDDQNDGESARNGNARRPSSASFTGQRNSRISVRQQSMQNDQQQIIHNQKTNEQSELDNSVQEEDGNDGANDNKEIEALPAKRVSVTSQPQSVIAQSRRQSTTMKSSIDDIDNSADINNLNIESNDNLQEAPVPNTTKPVSRRHSQVSIRKSSFPQQQKDLIESNNDVNDSSGIDNDDTDDNKKTEALPAKRTSVSSRPQSMAQSSRQSLIQSEQGNQVPKENDNDAESGEKKEVEDSIPNESNNYLKKITKIGNKKIREYDSSRNSYGRTEEIHTYDENDKLKEEIIKYDAQNSSDGRVEDTRTYDEHGKLNKGIIKYDAKAQKNFDGRVTDTRMYDEHGKINKWILKYDTNVQKNPNGRIESISIYDKNDTPKEVTIKYDPTKNNGIAKYESKDGRHKYYNENNQAVN